MLNIPAWSDVRQKFCIIVDTAVENAIVVHVREEKTLKFVEVGLVFIYYRNLLTSLTKIFSIIYV